MNIAANSTVAHRRVPAPDDCRGVSGVTTVQRISTLLDMVLEAPRTPHCLLDTIVAKGIAGGLDWYEIVSAVDEAERRTGLQLHPASHTPFP